MFTPQTVSVNQLRKLIPATALFNIAATLKGGTYQPRELESQIGTLFTTYALIRSDEIKSSLQSQNELQQDRITHLGNALVFVVAWIFIPWLLPAGNPLAIAIKDVFWAGLRGLLIYVAIARARLLFALRLSLVLFVQIIAALVQKDPFYEDKLAMARSNPEPYRQLVELYLAEPEADRTPSLTAYLRSIFTRKKTEPSNVVYYTLFSNIRQFGWDQVENRNYKDSRWLIKYLAWRALQFLDQIGAMFKIILTILGVRRL
jgi:hypothetical protein